MRYSIITAGCECGPGLAAQMEGLEAVLRRLVLPFEVICVEDASCRGALAPLEPLVARHAWLRILRVDRPRGVSAAIAAGVAASRGEIVVVVDLAHHDMRQIPNLIAGLSRTDFVIGGRRREKAGGARGPAPQTSIFASRRDLKDPKSLFWAARREVVVDLRLAHGMYRHLPRLVTLRGFRVGDPNFGDSQQPRGRYVPLPAVFNRLALWWLQRGWQPCVSREFQPSVAPCSEGARTPSAEPLPAGAVALISEALPAAGSLDGGTGSVGLAGDPSPPAHFEHRRSA